MSSKTRTRHRLIYLSTVGAPWPTIALSDEESMKPDHTAPACAPAPMRMRPLHTALVLFFILSVVGCTSYAPMPLDSAAQFEAFGRRSLVDPDLRPILATTLQRDFDVWPPESWDLEMLTAVALHFQPDMAVARARLDTARAGARTARARSNPSLALSLQRNSDAVDGVSPWTYGLGLDMPIQIASKRDLRVTQAQFLADAAVSREHEVNWSTRSRVRAAWVAVYSTEKLLTQQQQLKEQILIIVERRLRAGYASQSEVALARQNWHQSTFDLISKQRQRDENLSALALAIGVPTRAVSSIALSFDDFEELVPIASVPVENVRREALLRRHDLLAVLAEYEASQSALQLEVAKQYPDISLGPGYTWDAGAVKWSLGLNIALPVFDRNQGPIAEAQARRDEAAANVRTVQAKAIVEAEQTVAGYGHAVRLFQEADQILREQSARNAIVQASLKVGAGDQLDWLVSQIEMVNSQMARSAALIDAQQVLGRLEDALRHPLRPAASAFAPPSPQSTHPTQLPKNTQ